MARADLVQRVLVGVLAVVAIVWLAVSVADMHALRDSQKVSKPIFDRHASAAARRDALRRSIARTRDAESLRPGDYGPLAQRVLIYAFSGRTKKALMEAERLARVEPQNRLGWLAIENLTASTDPARAAQAMARLRALQKNPADRG